MRLRKTGKLKQGGTQALTTTSVCTLMELVSVSATVPSFRFRVPSPYVSCFLQTGQKQRPLQS